MAHVIARDTLLGHVGDVNPIDYGGGFVLQDAPQAPEVEYYEGLDGDSRQGPYDDDRDERIEALSVRVYTFECCCTGYATLAECGDALDQVEATWGDASPLNWPARGTDGAIRTWKEIKGWATV